MTFSSIGVVGLGLLGRGIVACLLARGVRVIAVTRTADEFEAARPALRQMRSELLERGLVAGSEAEDWDSLLTPSTTCDALQDVPFVIESVTEDLATKQAVFDELERVLAPTAVVASNTSAIPISLLQQTRQHPERFVGMHWAEPAHATRFLEIIRGEATSDETIDRTADLARQLGKDPTICQKDVPGFIVNRIGYAMYREALALVEEGVADVETIDRSLRNTLGLWAASCGPFRWIDLTGGPALYAKAMERVLPTLSTSATIPAPLARLAEADSRGIANGRGFYEYDAQQVHDWEDRQRRYVWQTATWLDAEFPIDSVPAKP